jgi:hypothetical protein
MPDRLWKKSIHGLFPSQSKKCDFCFALFFNHLQLLKNGDITLAGYEKRVFAHPAKVSQTADIKGWYNDCNRS